MNLRIFHLFRKRNLSPRLKQEWGYDILSPNTEQVLKDFKSAKGGLTEKEAARRLKLYGFNEPAEKQKRKLFYEIIMEFANPLIVLLLVIGTFSVLFGEKFSAIIIYVMAAMSGLLSFFQEHRAEKAVEKLNALVRVTTAVIRNGKEEEKSVKILVPGDIISLSAGDTIPADLRIIEANGLFVNQSALTGESMPIEKYAQSQSLEKPSRIFESDILAFMGSSVASGTGLGIAVHTGRHTEFGKLSENLGQVRPETAFDKGIKNFTWMMIKAILIMVVLIVLINTLGKLSFFESLLFALAVAVGLAPETLPMIVTINLSKGALLMSKKKVVVKRLDAIQNFGAMDILCTDKTGTLTLNAVVLEKYSDVYGKDDLEVLEYGFLNSFYQTGLKNLLDQAVLKHEHPHLTGFEKIGEIPFDFERKIMSVAIKKQNRYFLIAKGAPEEIFKRSSYVELDEKVMPVSSELIAGIDKQYQDFSSKGFRVLAIAYKELLNNQNKFSTSDESRLILKGFMAFLDPAKPDAKTTVGDLEKVGIKIKILTGDNDLVTKKICEDIGIKIEGTITGEEVENLSEGKLSEIVENANIFTRMLPMQKQRIIKTLQKNGHTVGFLGDGINDSSALKAADVGISVNNAADVARESASIILLQKSLAVLYDGVVEGRKVFGNIIKYIRMSSSSNFGNMLSVTGASLFLPFLPMLPVQILLNNFLYDVSQIGIPTDGVDREYVEKPRPWRIDLIKKYMLLVGPVSSIFDFLTYAIMWWVFEGYMFPSLFQTGWFIESLFSQTLVVYVIRTRKLPFLQSWPSRGLVMTTLFVLSVGVIIPYTKLAGFFGFVRPPALYFWLLAAMMVVYLFLVQIVKNWFIQKFEKE